MRSRIRTSLILLLALIGLFSAARLDRIQGANQAVTVIRIGTLMRQNSQADLGARLAVQEINVNGAFAAGDGRVYSLELVYPNIFPTAPEDIPRALDSLKAQEVSAVIGPLDNALALPNLEPLARAGVPVLTLATSDTLTDFDVTNNIMRMQASERYYSIAAAEYMVNELQLTNIAVVQTNVESTEAVVAFEGALGSLGYAPITKIQLVDASTLSEQIPGLVTANPDGIIFWGAPQDVNVLLSNLFGRGWNGVFFYRDAQKASLAGQLDLDLAAGIYGVSGWAYSTQTELSRQFLINFVSAYGRVPDETAAAAYDAVYTLAGQIKIAGPSMPGLYESLLRMQTVYTVQGRIEPYENGDFSRNVTIFRLSEFGGIDVLARYKNTERLPDDDLVVQELNPVAVIGTPTFTPTMTPTETATYTPSPTPSQLQLTVISDTVNVRSGPGLFYEEIGQFQRGATATIVGANEDLSWLVIQYRGGIGWVAAEFVEVFDPGGLLNQLPIIQAPPTPIGGVTATPRLNLSDIVIDNVLLMPLQPVPGQGFVASVTVRNAASAPTGQFVVAASFEPGPVYTSNIVSNLEPGQTLTVPLSVTLLGTGTFAVDIVADINNEVNEGENGEGNNIYRVNYAVDYPILIQTSSLPVFAGTNVDLAGGVADLNWTGTELVPLSGGRVGIVTSATFETVHYNLLDPAIISNTTGLSESQIFPGVLIGVITAEGQRGIIRIEARAGTAITISYKIYSNP